MKSSVLRQASLPSQDNLSSSEEKLQQPGRRTNAQAPYPLRHQAAQEAEEPRHAHPAANDASNAEPMLSLISIQQVMNQTRVGRTMIYGLIKSNEFPRPVKVCGASRWVQHEVSDWIRSLMQKRQQVAQ